MRDGISVESQRGAKERAVAQRPRAAPNAAVLGSLSALNHSNVYRKIVGSLQSSVPSRLRRRLTPWHRIRASLVHFFQNTDLRVV
jgi:hypothetical protein